ncbi:MAG: dockerin type I repeat-containing protein, partial [Oscillospiraceae bacterium]|nr:dockerin type I repeat-containing protein [Oscillospiraceae bacterium]
IYTIRSDINYDSYLTTDSNGSLIVTEKDDNSVYQHFGLEKSLNSNICKITAGGWYVAPDDNGNIIMTDDISRAEWELIDINNLGAVGDVNKDNIINIYDLIFAKKIVKNQDFSDIMKASRADVNGDGILDTEDIKLLQQFIANKITRFPAFMVNLKPNTIFPTVEVTNPDPDPIPTEPNTEPPTESTTEPTTEPIQEITLADMPAEYKESAEWIWQNRCVYEGSTTRRNTIFDQIYAGNGTINFVVRWQSYKTITYEQRQQFEKLASDSINVWNNWLKNYDGWKYDHIDVKIVGWAVLDKNCLLDLHDDEIVYDNLISEYDSQYDTSNGIETIPDKLPSAPDEISRFEHFAEADYQYPNGLENRFDMYLWATQGFPSIGGSGGDWGQRLSDDAYINMLDGTNVHVLEHEIGHGFGITDFYGENGTNAGPPPNGFPDDGTSIMMAGSSTKITNFDGWLLRYMWSQIKDEDGRF